jgi:iron complex outermembrane receptor protein
MDEVLRSMPLIQIRSNSRGEAQPSLRGSEDRQIAILMDGVPLTLGWDHRTDMSIIPLTAARSVTLVRGLSSVLYGPNTLGGVVQVDLTRGAQRVERVAPLEFGLSWDHAGGTSLSATAGQLLERDGGQFVIRTGAGFQDREGMPLAGGVLTDPALRQQFVQDGDLRLNSDSRRLDGFVSARYRADGGAWASVSASGYDSERGVPPEAHQDDPRLWRYPEQRRLIAAVSGGTGIRETGGGAGDLEASLGIDLGSTSIEQFTSEAFQTVDATEDSDDRVITGRLLGEHTLGARGDLRASATYADISHDEVLNGGGLSSYRQRLWSAAVEGEVRFGSSGLTRLTLGGVLDGADTPEAGPMPSVEEILDFGARLGASSLVADGFLVHGGLSRRSRFPSLRELYSGALGRFEPNPELGPEILVGAEAGFTLSKGPSEVQIVGFHHRFDDGIVRTSFTGTDGLPRFRRINQDEVRSTGLEFLVVGGFGPTTATADLTVQDVKGFAAGGSEVELEYEPSIMGKLGLELPLPAQLRGSGDLRFVGEQRCENPEVGGLQPLSASTSVDVALRRIFSLGRSGPLRRFDASASLQNLTDAAVFDQCGLPQPGRLLRFQLRIW